MKNFILQLLFVLTVVVGFGSLPTFATAQTSSTECERLRDLIKNNGGGQALKLPAYCDTGTIYTKITSGMYYIIGIAAVISLIYAGYMYMTARDNEAQLKKAKNIFIWTIAGLVLALTATIIVNVIANLIVDNKLF